MQKRAILVVGHKHWGKSKTLKALTNDKHSVVIDGQTFFVRRMSNDDKPEEYREFIESLNGEPLIILAFCPTFAPGGDAPKVVEILLRKGYELSFFVLEERYRPLVRSRNEIDQSEFDAMEKIAPSRVHRLKGKMSKEDRAKELEAFIRSVLTDA